MEEALPLERPPVETAAVGFHDPLQPPITDPATRGRIPFDTPTPLFVRLFADAEDAEVAMMALQLIMPEVARFVSTEIGNTLIKKDSRYKQRWEPLKQSTLRARKYAGRYDDYPYSDQYAYNWQNNIWGTSVQTDENTVTAGIGPSQALQSHTDWSKTHLSQYGTPPGHGDGPENMQQKVARPIGLSEEIARKTQAYFQERLTIAMKNFGARKPAQALLAPDMIQTQQLPLWVQ